MATPTNNIAALRDRAELFADVMLRHCLTPEQAGYVAVSMACEEVAVQLRYVADRLLTPRQAMEVAEQFSSLARDVRLLGQIQTDTGG